MLIHIIGGQDDTSISTPTEYVTEALSLDREWSLRVVHLGQSTCHAISGRGD